VSLLQPSFTKRVIFFMISDIILFYISLHFAYALRFDFLIEPKHMSNFLNVFIVLTLLKLLFMALFRIYNITWRFFSLRDAKRLVMAHIAALIVFGIVLAVMPSLVMPLPRSAIVIDFFLSVLLMGGFRLSKRLMIEQHSQGADKPTLIIGVNAKTASVIKSAFAGDIPYRPVAIAALLEENKSAVNTYIDNVKIFDADDLEMLVHSHQIEAAIITSTFSPKILKALHARLYELGILEIKQVKLLGSQHEKLEDLSIEDLLARHPKDLDQKAIAAFIRGKTVLITGAGGSIGSEIARQCKNFKAASLILVDNSEYNLYQIGEEIAEAELKLISVTDKQALENLFRHYKIDTVIHAAAYKHVPICEANQDAAIINNILGTKNIIDLSIQYEIEKLVIISTDKAVRPTNVMGATKRVTELYAGNVDAKKTEIVAVRFGNVLGSSGSVIPKFKQQIEAGGPVTVTDAKMTRYFMLIAEACQLVLQAATIAKGGELFILDMGEPVKIVDLARQMIRLYGKEDEVEIVFSGLRPGEKLYEELLIDESEQKTRYSSIFIAGKTDYGIEELENDISVLMAADDKIAALKKMVPEFSHQP